MDYEKKYKEAIERMKSWAKGEHPECFSEAQKAAEFVFPELKEKESKDERIRKDLIRWVKLNISYERMPVGMNYSNECVLAWLEKQGKQKPAAKIEPKFKIGDWIVGEECICKVVDIRGRFYKLYFMDGQTVNIDIPYADEKYQLWTIEDAKDGDVLADDESIIIFRKIGNDIWNDVIDFYVCYNFRLDKIIVQKDSLHCGTIKSKTIKPATKEHRGFLFSKMKEAGYEWDVENKVLRKQGEQKSVWSEEDDMMIEKIIDDVTPLGECPDYPTEKQRKFYEECNEEIEWLKSIKQKFHWKPTEEQIRALEHFVGSIGHYDNNAKLVQSLLNDLKKL